MERERCIRCGGEMVHIGREKLQLGEYSLLTGYFGQPFSRVLTVNIYCCRDCKRLEFYDAMEPPEDAEGEPGSMAQAPCPYCGLLHEMDDPKCPHCGRRLLE